MRNTLTTIFCLFVIAMFVACSGDHDHGPGSNHSHSVDHSDEDHSHGEDTHSHDDAPATEALYGDEAALPDDADETAESAPVEAVPEETNPEEHTHGDSDEPHTHD